MGWRTAVGFHPAGADDPSTHEREGRARPVDGCERCQFCHRARTPCGENGASSDPDSPLTLVSTVDRNVVTGTWVEQTAVNDYWNGARDHGVVQLLVEPTGRRMAGKWVGFGRDFDVNTGPWELRLVDGSTSKTTLERYSASPE